MDHTAGFVEEIEFRELEFGEVVGRGAFGVVSKAKWRNMDVAVKLIETESEKKAFKTELTQLSRVNHPNIVRLYGACTKQPVCLVMEYAEGGSLYNVLHGEGPQPEYTCAHAMSWCVQCASGVEYLHGMKPKPLIHRDLKPPNLLLVAGGTTLKICDFGTACDAHTHMTNNKGSAAWMAPEVFEGCNYSEKCDVFSWGIILWEVITRRKPFDEIGGPAFRIMWAVHNGKRPPLVQNCPKAIEILMTRCWSANPVERPSMSEVVRIMTHLFQFFHGADEPLRYPQQVEDEKGHLVRQSSSVFETPPPTNQSVTGSVDGVSIHETVRLALTGDTVPLPRTTHKATKTIVVEEDSKRRTSAPASLAASQESLLDKSSRPGTPSIDLYKRYSADLTRHGEIDFVALGAKIPPNHQPFVRGHRRTGSHDLPVVSAGTGTVPGWSHPSEVRGHRRSGSYGNSPAVTSSADVTQPAQPLTSTPNKSSGIHHSVTSPANLETMNWEPGAPIDMANVLKSGMFPMFGPDTAKLTMAMVAMDHQLQPLAPNPTSHDSMAVFQEHCELAQNYSRVQTEVVLLTHRQHELSQELDLDEQEQQASTRFAEQYQQLMTENEQLMMLQNNLMKQVGGIRQQSVRRAPNV